MMKTDLHMYTASTIVQIRNRPDQIWQYTVDSLWLIRVMSHHDNLSGTMKKPIYPGECK
jgi:hypothetical protein